MKVVCKKCGEHLELPYGEREVFCPICKKSLKAKELLPEFTLKDRKEQLRLMDSLIRLSNDENIFFIWINDVPDEASDEDLEFIAYDDERYNEVFDLFCELISEKGVRY